MGSDFSSLLLAELPDAIVVVTPDARIVFWNHGAEALFGFTADEARGRGIHELIVPPDRAEEERGIRRQAEKSGVAVFESLRMRKDGSFLYVDISTKAVRSQDGGISYFISSKKDVTHLKALRDAKFVDAKFRDLLESVPDGVVMVNPTGRIVLANSQAETLFGYGRGSMIALQVEDLMAHRYREGHVSHRSTYFGQPRVRAMGIGLELYGLRQDGTEFPVEISLSPLVTEQGTLVMGVIRDTTERKAQENLRRAELEEQNRRILETTRLKSEFLARMSHELRTPLNGIIGFSEFLVDEKAGPITPLQREYLDDVLDCGKHLLRLINDVLDLAKVEAGKMDLHPEEFSLSGTIEEVSSVVGSMIRQKQIAYHARVEKGTDPVRLDQQKLRQILYNLLSNAAKFTPDRGRVEVHASPAGDGRIRIAVVDTGIGIRPEDIPRLFVEFQQLDAGTERRYPGSGLGLALTRRLTELMGGTIAVESAPGRGSTFTVSLPRRIETA